jgi:hypothetical protein
MVAVDAEGLLWVEPSGSIAVPRTAVIELIAATVF